MANSTQATEFINWINSISPAIDAAIASSNMSAFTAEVNNLVSELNANTQTLSSAENIITKILTDPQAWISGQLSKPTSTTVYTKEIMQYVYYYPPNINANDILNISTDGYTGNIEITYNNTFTAGGTMIGKNVVSIFTTPTGFINWYTNNRGSIATMGGWLMTTLTDIYTALTSPVVNAGITYSNAEQQQIAYYDSMNFTLIPYAINTGYTVSPTAINPVSTYGLTSNELYMLLLTNSKTIIQQQISGASLTQTSSATAAQQQLQGESATTAITNAAKSAAAAASSITSSPEFYLVLGAVAFVAIAIIAVKVK